MALPTSQSQIDAALNAMMNQQQQLNQLGGLSNGRHWLSDQAPYGYPAPSLGPGDYGTIGFPSLSDLGTIRTAKPRPPVENAGIRAGEIVGWRCWRLRLGLLRSMVADVIWAPDEPMEGRVDDHGLDGVHAWKKHSKALAYADCYRSGHVVAVGQVELWGEVVEHEHGYRAEFASILSLDRIINGWFRRQRLRRLRAEYGVGGTIVDAAQHPHVHALDQRERNGPIADESE